MSLREDVIWKLKARDEVAEIELARAAGVHSLVAAVLRARGITTPQAARDFLDADLGSLRDPLELPDMRPAAERIVLAVGNGESLLVHGDYDADGITATALLVRFLNKLGADVHYYIPHRLNERYGLSPEALRHAIDKGIKLILAVDCGVSDNEAIAEAQRLGADVIVIDHHEPGPELPDTIVVDPKRHDFEGDYDDLAAVGLAYNVAAAVCMLLELPIESLRRAFLDLVAIGTVADVVQLKGDNRIMVKHGLQLLPHTRKEGLRALMDISQISGELTAQDIGYRIAPRLNAVGRMGDATEAVDLLLAEDPEQALKLAVKLEGHNAARQREQKMVFCDALAMVSQEVDLEHEPVVVLGSDNWHIGVVGIVASNVVDRFHRPAFLMCRQDDTFRGRRLQCRRGPCKLQRLAHPPRRSCPRRRLYFTCGQLRRFPPAPQRDRPRLYAPAAAQAICQHRLRSGYRGHGARAGRMSLADETVWAWQSYAGADDPQCRGGGCPLRGR